MYRYYHRISDRYDKPVVSLAVLADENPTWKPTEYKECHWGCRLLYQYPVCKLLELNEKELEKTDNPIAIVIAAHLTAQRTGMDRERKNAKWQLTRRLYERGYEKEEILELYRLIDWLLELPDELELEFRQERIDYEKEKVMPHITAIERIARAEGHQQGHQQGRQEGRQEGQQEGEKNALKGAIITTLEARFKEVPWELRKQINQVEDLNRLTALLRQAATCTAMSDFKGV